MYIIKQRGIKIKRYLFESFNNKDINNQSIDIIIISCFLDYFNTFNKKYYFEKDNSAVLNISTYNNWFLGLSNKTRNMIRKSEKSGLVCDIKYNLLDSEINDIWEIYTETPIRQGRFSPYYALMKKNISSCSGADGLFFLAKKDSKVIGYIHLLTTDLNIAHINTILSLNKALDLAPNNFLISEVVRYCANKEIKKLTYARMNIPSLNKFKQNNGFVEEQSFNIIIPLTKKGKIAKVFKLYKSPKDFIPNKLKQYFMPTFNFFSRIYAKIYILFHKVKV